MKLTRRQLRNIIKESMLKEHPLAPAIGVASWLYDKAKGLSKNELKKVLKSSPMEFGRHLKKAVMRSGTDEARLFAVLAGMEKQIESGAWHENAWNEFYQGAGSVDIWDSVEKDLSGEELKNKSRRKGRSI